MRRNISLYEHTIVTETEGNQNLYRLGEKTNCPYLSGASCGSLCPLFNTVSVGSRSFAELHCKGISYQVTIVE